MIGQIEESTDILADGTQDPDKDCDGISIGLTFDAAPIDVAAANR